MKAIIQCYTPKEIERIARGEQTIKVCKTAPKETPFKVYMYKKPYAGGAKIINEVLNGVYSGGKVVGDYMCERVIKYPYISIACAKYEVNGADVKEQLRYNAGACLNAEEMYSLSNGKDLCGLHITAVKIYDEPKSLNSFKIACNKSIQCNSCEYRALRWHEDKKDFYYECGRPAITHAPRGWQYVEEL